MEFSFDREKLIERYQPDFAMAYGSGVFRQEGYSETEKPMIDFIFGVDDPIAWHRRNLRENGRDYSFIAQICGENFVSWLQGMGAGIYYNPYVDFEGQTIKYGVISTADLIDDLNNWTSLYVAGRLHKPVEILKSTDEIDDTIKVNLEHAVNVAYYLCFGKHTEQELYEAIAGISYLGDSRMKFAENPDKVKNIVSKNLEGFRELYGNVPQKISMDNYFEMIDELPENLRDVWLGSGTKILPNAISSIVHSSSISQTMKGLVSAGLFKSIRYVMEKMKKAKR
jgi:mitochondrial translocator assembly and maintenance protein 41